MKRLLLAAAALAAIGAAASPAAAQMAGTYSGTSGDGNSVSFTVATDPNTGNLAITGESVNFSALCNDTTYLTTGWGLGFTQDIVSRKVTNTTAFNYLTNTFNLTFSADGLSATGFISSESPTLTPVGPTPKKALFCRSKRQPMGVTFQSGATKAGPPAHGAVWLGTVAPQ